MSGVQSKLIKVFLLLLFAQVSVAQTDFQLTVSPSGNPITLPVGGGQSALTYTVANDANGVDEGDQTTVTFFYDFQIEPVSVTAMDQNWSCSQVTGQINCNYNGIYFAGYSSDLQFFLTTPTAPTNITNAVNASISNALGDPNPGNNSIISDISFVPAGGVNLGLSKTITSGFPSTLAPGDAISFDLTVTNLTGGDATNVVVLDDIMTNNLQFDAVSSSPECIELSTMVQCSTSFLASGDAITFTLATTVDSFAQPGNKINTASVSATELDPDMSNNSSNQAFTVAIGGSPEIGVSKAIIGGFTQIVQGGMLDYIIEVNNTGVGDAVNVDLSDVLPVGVSYVSHLELGPNFSCTYSAPTINCNAPTLPNTTSQDGVRISVVVDGPVNAAISNTAISSFIDGNASNNTDTVLFNIISPTADLDLSMDTNPAAQTSYAVGDLVGLELTLHNPLTSTGAPNATVSTTLAPEMVFNSAQVTNVPGWLCTHDGSASGGVVACNSQSNPVAIGSNVFIQINSVAASPTTSAAAVSAVVVSDYDPNTANDNASVGFNITAATADLSLIFTSAAGVYNTGDVITYVAQIENPLGFPGTDPADAVVVFTLPNAVSFNAVDTSVAAGWSCQHDNAVSGGQLTCGRAGAPFTAGSVHVITVSVNATTATNSAAVQGTISSVVDANPANNIATQTDVINASASDFTTNMVSDPEQVNTGQTFKHTIAINNTGAVDLLSVASTYRLPSVATLVEVNANGFSCTVVTPLIECIKSQPLQVNGSTQIEVLMQVNEFMGTVSGVASVLVDGSTQIASTVTQVVSNFQSDLSLVKTANVTEVGVSEVYTYMFEVTNVGTVPHAGFTLNDSLPSGVVLQSITGSDWNCTGSVNISCQYQGTLTSNSQAQLNIAVLAPPQAGVITNTAELLSTADQNNLNNSSSATVSVVDGQGSGSAYADLSVAITANNANPLNSEQVSWSIMVQNQGPDAATNVLINNQFPVGFVAGNVQVNNGAACTLLEASLQCEIAVLAANQSNEILIEGGFVTGYAGLFVNTVDVVSDAIDNNPNNDMSQAQVMVSAAGDMTADLALSLNANNQQIQQGGSIELSLMVKNLGPDKAINSQINGQFSGLIENIQILNTHGWVCQVNTSNLNCMYPGDFILGMQSMIDLKVQTQQVVQQGQPIVFSATVEADTPDNQPANNVVGFTNEVTSTPTEDEIFAIFEDAVGSGASDTVMQTIRNVSSYCARKYFMAMEGLCEQFIEGATPQNRGAIINAMEEITPNEVVAQSNSAAEVMTSQFRNVGSRLAQLRGGGGAGFSVAGLNGRYGNESIPLGMLAYLNQSEEEQAVSNINDFVSPWGFFVNGSISLGERDATGRELGFDFDTYGITAGVDYRFSATKVAGLALGYANFDSDIEGEAEMQSTALTLTGYGSFYIKDNFYVDARISYGQPNFEQKRRINFAVDDILIDRVATGKTDANQYAVAMSAGYHFSKNSWTITPNASMRYVRTTIDAFQETGAGGFSFAFGEQQVKSMVWSVGTSISKAISLKNGIISPQFDFNLSRETENDGGLLAARFITAPDDEIFWIGTDEPDRTYGDAGLGLVFVGANGKQAYINYRSIFGLEGFTRGTINVGARFEF